MSLLKKLYSKISQTLFLYNKCTKKKELLTDPSKIFWKKSQHGDKFAINKNLLMNRLQKILTFQKRL
jgi:hypothetical protein